MTIQIRKAQRCKAKLRLGLAAPSGGGKTMSALLIAKGLGGKVLVIDTENGSADLYSHVMDYDVITLEAPFSVSKYLESIKAGEDAGYNTIIVDSLSHAWAGSGGLLEKQGKITDRMGGDKNSYAAWRQVTPEHNHLVEAMLQSSCHIIATMRSKTEYVLEANSQGKMAPKKVGMAPVQRDGMEYEFTVMLDIDHTHTASSSKDRTQLFDGQFFIPSEKTGKQLLAWLEAGEAPIEKKAEPVEEAQPVNETPAEPENPLMTKKFTDCNQIEECSELYRFKESMMKTPEMKKKLLDACNKRIDDIEAGKE